MLGRRDAAGGAASAPGEDNSKIHIFSVASGHLYERFTKIMVLSVLKNTHTPVKFWFLKNYTTHRLGFQMQKPQVWHSDQDSMNRTSYYRCCPYW